MPIKKNNPYNYNNTPLCPALAAVIMPDKTHRYTCTLNNNQLTFPDPCTKIDAKNCRLLSIYNNNEKKR